MCQRRVLASGAEEWADLVSEEYNGEEDPNDSMTVDGTMVPTTPTKSNENQDENLNRISPQQTTVGPRNRERKTQKTNRNDVQTCRTDGGPKRSLQTKK